MSCYLSSLIKKEDPQSYAKLANEGVLLAHPITIDGKNTRPDNGIGYHASIKEFNKEKDHPHKIHDLAQHLLLNAPDSKNTQIEPGQFTDRNGATVYVLKLKGNSAEKLKEHNGKFAGMGFPSKFEWQPHISVDKATHDRIKSSGAKTAHEAGIEFSPAELKRGQKVLKTYHHEADTTEPRVPDEGDFTAHTQLEPSMDDLAASEDTQGENPLEKGVMRRIAPFKPDPTSPMNRKVARWQSSNNPNIRSTRNGLEQSKEAKIRAFHKLHSNTSVRKNPKTGEREYLLHRGMGGEEHGSSVSPTHVTHDLSSSWTPHRHIAASFSREEGPEGRTVSAWIPESKIQHVPKQEGGITKDSVKGPNTYSNEHEVVVRPHSSPLATGQERSEAATNFGRVTSQPEYAIKSPRLNQRINARGGMPNENARKNANAQNASERKMGLSDAFPTKVAKSELPLEKGFIQNAAAGIGMAAALASPAQAKQTTAHTHKAPIHQATPKSKYDHNKMMDAIREVESSSGINRNKHPIVTHGRYKGQKAYGDWALMPDTIKETIQGNKDLRAKHGKATGLSWQNLHRYLDDNKGLERDIASRHVKRLEHHFGPRPDHIARAWNSGISGTKKEIHNKVNIGAHDYVQKVKGAYNRGKTKVAKN